MQNTPIFSRKISIFPTSNREQHVFVFSLTSKITPFESTFDNWEVMSSILSHDRMKKSLFSQKDFNFSDFKPECNKFYSGPGRNSLHRNWPPPKSPLPTRGKRGEYPPLLLGNTYCYISESFNFFDFWPRAICVRLLFFMLDHPLRKHPCQLGGNEFNSQSWQNGKIRFSQKISSFPTWERDVIGFIQVRAVSTPSDVPLAP